MRKKHNKHGGFVNPVQLVNPVYTGFILPTYLEVKEKNFRPVPTGQNTIAQDEVEHRRNAILGDEGDAHPSPERAR